MPTKVREFFYEPGHESYSHADSQNRRYANSHIRCVCHLIKLTHVLLQLVLTHRDLFAAKNKISRYVCA